MVSAVILPCVLARNILQDEEPLALYIAQTCRSPLKQVKTSKLH